MASTALITGGTSGIGRAVANKLVELGIHVLVVELVRRVARVTSAMMKACAWQIIVVELEIAALILTTESFLEGAAA